MSETMNEEKLKKWAKHARALRWELSDALTFFETREVVFWAMANGQNPHEDDGGLLIQSIIKVYQEYTSMLVRKLSKRTKQDELTISNLLHDLLKNYDLARKTYDNFPSQESLELDIEALDTSVYFVNHLADKIYAHADPLYLKHLQEGMTQRDVALQVMLVVGKRYVQIMTKKPLQKLGEFGTSEPEIRDAFGHPWIRATDAVPNFFEKDLEYDGECLRRVLEALTKRAKGTT